MRRHASPPPRRWAPWPHRALCLALAVTAGACSQPPRVDLPSLALPIAAVTWCASPPSAPQPALPLDTADACAGETSQGHVVAYVLDAATEELRAIDITAGEALDLDPFRLSFNGIPLGFAPVDAASIDDVIVVGGDARAQGGAGILAAVSTRDPRVVAGEAALDEPPTALAAWKTAQGDRWVFVGLAGERTVSRIPMDHLADAAHGSLDALPLADAPTDLVVVPGEGGHATLWVAFAHIAAVASIELPAWDAVRYVPVGPACSDGLDNDGDGLVDARDPACASPLDPDESADPHEAQCADGVDNDGDGATDYPDDPGCAAADDPSEWSDRDACHDGLDNDADGLVDGDDPQCAASPHEWLTACEDGADNDGDGQTDGDDPDCAASAGEREAGGAGSCRNGIDDDADGMTDDEDPDCAAGRSERRPGCANGADDDADGMADAQDASCWTRRDEVEGLEPPALDAQLAVSPRGDFLYVTQRARHEVVVVDLQARTAIDVDARPGWMGHPLHAFEGRRGIVVPAPPVDIAFAEGRAQVADGSTSPAQTALVATATGEVDVIDATVDALGAVHALRSSKDEPARATPPRVFVGGVEKKQSFAVRVDVPHLGPFAVDEDARTWYGVTFPPEGRHVPAESWTLWAGGVLPGSERRTGRLLQVGDDAEGPYAVWSDPWADYCRIGVEPGDRLEVVLPERMTCTDPAAPGATWKGERFLFAIASVEPDRLVLRPARFDGDPCLEADAAAGPGGLGIDVLTPQEHFEALDLPGEHPTRCRVVPLPSPACFGGELAYRVRVPRTTFLALGSRTGFVHPWEHRDAQCVRRTSDPRATSRVHQLVPAGPAPTSCDLALGAGQFADETPFENFSFSLVVFPGCTVLDAISGQAQYVPTWRDTRLQFDVHAGFVPRRLIPGPLPMRVIRDRHGGKVILLEASGPSLLVIDPLSLEIPVSIR